MEPTDNTTTTSNSAGNGRATKQRAQSTAHDTVDRAARGAHDAVDRFAEKAGGAAERMGAKGEKFTETKERLMTQTRTYVQTHPVASIGIAVAAGFLLSSLMRSNHHQ